MTPRRSVFGVVSIVWLFALLIGAAPAFAGGSWFDTTEAQYAPGDTVTMIGYTSGGQLGWLEDGPFYGYLRVRQPDPATAKRWPIVSPADLALGPLKLEKTGMGGNTLRATITFDLPPGLEPRAYDFVYCNKPCTTGLGDLIGGTVHVGASPSDAEPALPPSTTAATAAPRTTAAASTQQPGSTRSNRASWTIGGLVLVAASTAGALLTRRRIRSSRY